MSFRQTISSYFSFHIFICFNSIFISFTSARLDYHVVLFKIARQSYLDYLKSISKAEDTEMKTTTCAVSEPGCSHANDWPQESSDDSIGVFF